MSTRATIKITKGDQLIRLYHHCDGYPAYLGWILKDILSCFRSYWSMDDIANELVKNTCGIGDDNFEITSAIHGDEDYLYWIDCDNKELHCYRMEWDEEEEDIIKPEREIEL